MHPLASDAGDSLIGFIVPIAVAAVNACTLKPVRGQRKMKVAICA